MEYSTGDLQYSFFYTGSKVGKFLSVTLDCDMTKAVCDLIPDTNVTIRIDFIAG